MQLVTDARLAEVVIIYVLGLRRALLIDKRRMASIGPWTAVLPQQELLLEGRGLEAPLTPQVVHMIERRQVLPADHRVMQSYFQQLLEAISKRLLVLRPALPPVERLSIGPHVAPVAALALSDLWRDLRGEFEQRGEQEALLQARACMRELLACEVEFAERRDPEELALLRRTPSGDSGYRVLGL